MPAGCCVPRCAAAPAGEAARACGAAGQGAGAWTRVPGAVVESGFIRVNGLAGCRERVGWSGMSGGECGVRWCMRQLPLLRAA